MLQSKLFSKTRKEAPKDETALNAKLLIRGGFIHKDMAGVYSYLPLGLRVLNNINGIIRQEMNKIGGVELFLSSLQSKEVWEKTDRWDDGKVDNWFKTQLKSGTELGLGFTHEEPLTDLMRDSIRSFRDLPVYVYQIQTKFRNEARAKSGLLRTREFLMKDLYSFSKDVTEHESFYEKAKQAYIDIFKRVGIGDKTYLTYASGGSFSKFSHEFQTETQSGEDLIHICSKCRVAVNDEIFSEQNKCPVCGGVELIDKKTVEVGNIFNLGTKFSDALSLKYIDETNKEKMVVMGSYGIGPGRLLGTIAEIFGGEKGINWPKEIAPFQAHVIVLGSSNEVLLQRDKVVQSLEGASIEPLVDDRDLSAGEKFSDADLIGVPVRIIVSEKTVKGGEVEIMTGAENKSFVAPEAVLRYFSS